MQRFKDTTKKSKGKQTNVTKRTVGLRLHTDEFAQVEKMARQQDRSISSLVRICMRIGIQQMQNGTES